MIIFRKPEQPIEPEPPQRLRLESLKVVLSHIGLNEDGVVDETPYLTDDKQENLEADGADDQAHNQ
jgi:hypothetical protein